MITAKYNTTTNIMMLWVLSVSFWSIVRWVNAIIGYPPNFLRKAVGAALTVSKKRRYNERYFQADFGDENDGDCFDKSDAVSWQNEIFSRNWRKRELFGQ